MFESLAEKVFIDLNCLPIVHSPVMTTGRVCICQYALIARKNTPGMVPLNFAQCVAIFLINFYSINQGVLNSRDHSINGVMAKYDLKAKTLSRIAPRGLFITEQFQMDSLSATIATTLAAVTLATSKLVHSRITLKIWLTVTGKP